MFRLIAGAGVSEDETRAYYSEVREKEFSLKKFISTLFSRNDIKGIDINKLYEAIMLKSPEFMNAPLVELVKKMGKDNCYIVTNGSQEFNRDKIKYSGIDNLFEKIYIVPGTKKEIIKEICAKNKNSKVVFIDDKLKFISDIDLKDCPNLKTIVYNDQAFRQGLPLLE
jgi:FMN phosphatase YigB (HAD superfamily)